jgi:hypothetical protein
MTRRLAPPLALALLALVLSAGPAGAVRRSCAAPHAGTILAATGEAQVYTVGQRYYACWLRTKRRTLLGRAYSVSSPVGEDHGLTDFAIAGRYVAFIDDLVQDPDVRTQSPVLVDVRRGRVAQAPNLVASPTGTFVLAIAATPGGTLAWIGDGEAGACQGLHAAGPDGVRTLDCGEATELAAASFRLYWMRGGAAQSAAVR